MSREDLRREPRRAYLEDDDEEEVATPLANVAVKRKSYERKRDDDGDQDSGYSSKTGTTSSSRRDMADLKLDTSAMQRQPQPYAFVQRPDARRRSSSHTRAEVSESRPSKQTYYVHKKGECYVCDTYGQHLPESARSGKENVVPPSPKASKQAQPQMTRHEENSERPIRRQSSVRGARPVSMYAPATPQVNYQSSQAANMMQYTAQPMSPAGWATPITPTMPYSPAFLYTPTVMTTTHISEPSYFDQHSLSENRPPRVHRRSTGYGDAVVLHSKVDTRPKEPQRTTSTREHGRTNSDRIVRADDYDRSMPPPPRPTITLAHRPSIKKSATYNTPLTPRTNRRSQMTEDDDAHVNLSSIRERRNEPSLPPNSYRGPIEATSDPRPPNRKSASYSAPTHTTSISSSLPPIQQRRSTTTATSDTRKINDAEAYQASRRSLTSTDLTAEALRTLKSRNTSSRSETSSHRSHHTKSSSSGGGKSKRSNSEIKMTINGINMSIPVSASHAEQKISISTRKDGDVSISLGGAGGGGASTVEREQRRIEKAPSASSRVSGKSVASRDRERERERERDLQEYEKLVRRQSRASASRSRSRADVGRRGSDYDHGHDRERERENPWNE